MLLYLPDQQRTLSKLPTELRCRHFVNKHRLSTQIGARCAKTCMQYVCNIFQLSFHFAYHRWWLGSTSTTKVLSVPPSFALPPGNDSTLFLRPLRRPVSVAVPGARPRRGVRVQPAFRLGGRDPRRRRRLRLGAGAVGRVQRRLRRRAPLQGDPLPAALLPGEGARLPVRPEAPTGRQRDLQRRTVQGG